MAYRGGLYKYFKSIDRYGKTISLTYNGQKTFSTFWGGFATFLTFFVCISWWVSQLVDGINNPSRNFTATTQTYLSTQENGPSPIYEINSDQFTLATRFFTTNTTVFNNTDLSTYLSVVYMQENADWDTGTVIQTFYNSTPCSVKGTSKLFGYNCLQIPDPQFTIQVQGMENTNQTKNFHMIVATCEDLSSITKRTDCVNSTFVLENLGYIQVQTQQITLFFDFINYNHPQSGLKKQLLSDRVVLTHPLNAKFYTKKRYQTIQTGTTVFNSWLYNFPFAKGQELMFYRFQQADTDYYSQNIQANSGQNYLLSYQYVQADQRIQQVYVRRNIFSLFALFGGTLSFITMLCSYMLSRIQNFSSTNSMIKKLYTQITPEGQDELSFKPSQKSESIGSQLLSYNLQNRSIFRLDYWTFRRNKDFNSRWCCCCRRSPDRKTKLFDDAQKRLTNELDILTLLKELRISRFVAYNQLKAHQMMLVRFFDDYTLDPENTELKRMVDKLQMYPQFSNKLIPKLARSSLNESASEYELSLVGVNNYKDLLQKFDDVDAVDKRLFTKVFPRIQTNDDTTERFDAEKQAQSETDVREILGSFSSFNLRQITLEKQSELVGQDEFGVELLNGNESTV